LRLRDREKKSRESKSREREREKEMGDASGSDGYEEAVRRAREHQRARRKEKRRAEREATSRSSTGPSPVFVYQGAPSHPAPVDTEHQRRILSEKFTGLDEYHEATPAWSTYVDVHADKHDPNKLRDPPVDDPAMVGHVLNEIADGTFGRRIRQLSVASVAPKAPPHAPVGATASSPASTTSEASPTKPVDFFSRSAEGFVTRDHLRANAADEVFVEDRFFLGRVPPPGPEEGRYERIPRDKETLIHNEPRIVRVLALLQNLARRPLGRQTMPSLLREYKCVGLKEFVVCEATVGRDATRAKVHVASLETFLDRVSTKDVFLLFTVFVPRADGVYCYLAHYLELLEVDRLAREAADRVDGLMQEEDSDAEGDDDDDDDDLLDLEDGTAPAPTDKSWNEDDRLLE
jgi:hypothetical protein